MDFDFRKRYVSRNVPHGPWTHESSPFANFGLGLHDVTAHEVSLSSSWLWHFEKLNELQFRFNMGYPDEWMAFQEKAKQTPLDFSATFNFWVFRNLTPQELSELKSLLQKNETYRVVIAANQFMKWHDLVLDVDILAFAKKGQASVCFLPPTQDLEPFLQPVEVLKEIENLPIEMPLFIFDASDANTNNFYLHLQKDMHAATLKSSSKAIPLLRKIDRWGFSFLNSSFEFALCCLIDLKMIIYPFRKIYWVLRHEFKKRVLGRDMNHES